MAPRLLTFANLEAASAVRTKINNHVENRHQLVMKANALASQAVAELDSTVPRAWGFTFGAGTATEETKRLASGSNPYTMDSNFASAHNADEELIAWHQQPVYARGLIKRTSPTTPAADSAADFQKFLNDVGGGVILVEDGVYDLETAVDIPPGTKIIGGHFVAPPAANLTYMFGCNGDDYAFDNVTFHGDTHDCLSVSNCLRININNCRFFGGDGSAIKLVSVFRGRITGCFAHPASKSDYISSGTDKFDEFLLITSSGTDDMWIESNFMEDCTNGGVITNNAKYLYVINNRGLNITGNGTNTGYFIQIYNTGVGEADNELCVVRGNLGYTIDGFHTYVQGARRIHVENNIGWDCQKNLLRDTGFLAGAIGVIPSNAGGYDIGGRQDTVISGNRLYWTGSTAKGDGIIFSGDNVHVTGNLVKGARTFAYQQRGGEGSVFDKSNIAIDCPIEFHRWTSIVDGPAGSFDRQEKNFIEQPTSNHPPLPPYMVGATVEPGKVDHHWSSGWTSVTQVKGGMPGQEVILHERYTGITLYDEDDSANVIAPISFLSGGNRSSAAGGWTKLRHAGKLVSLTKAIHDDNGVTTADIPNWTDDNESTEAALASAFTAAQDRLLFAFPRPIQGIYVVIGSVPNTVKAAITKVELSNGSSGWFEVDLFKDDTRVFDKTFGYFDDPGAGPETDDAYSLGSSGWITWYVPEYNFDPYDAYWNKDTYDGTLARWVALTFDGNLLSTFNIKEVYGLTYGWLEVANSEIWKVV